ncbi:hypothetical protein BCV71DRAFT_253674 [Rhizopus microsporus]|uniref:Uncharacterized protein n=1 Tax=Rhizopus microsporus TaxID=58291 RepID=A0A1X0SAF2_RHIZD|nr:hypothetical protein BCV71DRAFT_253674 [Rhizopus microsporus]
MSNSPFYNNNVEYNSYKPTNENQKRAKKHLQETGLIALHFCGQYPMRPAAIGLDVYERYPYTFLACPSTSILSPTETSIHDIIEDSDGNTNKSDDDCANVESNKDATSKANDNNDKAPQSQKHKFDDPVIPYCKDRVLHIMRLLPPIVSTLLLSA